MPGGGPTSPSRRAIRFAAGIGGRLIALAVIAGVFAIAAPDQFLTARNFENVLVQCAVVACAGVGATIVIVSGGIDLSVGSAIALGSVVVALVLDARTSMLAAGGDGAWAWALLAAGAGVGVTTLVGVVNGALVGWVRVVPFIVTLGTMQIVRGAAKGIAGERSVYAPDTWLNSVMDSVRRPERQWMLLPPGVWATLGLAACAAVLLRRTVLGRHIFAIGSNERAARVCGVHVPRTRLAVYTLAGLCAGVAAVLHYSYNGLGDPGSAQGLELYVIAAVVIGGGSLLGGEGTILGTLVGALIIATLDAGGVQLGWPKWVKEIMTGAIIIAAVALDMVRRRRQAA